MKRWRKIVIFTMILALPVSMWTSVSMASHCQTSNDTSSSTHAQMDHSQHMQMQGQTISQDASDHGDCECGCNGEINCSVSGCSVTALSSSVEINTVNSTQPFVQAVATLVIPQYSNLLLRPPIAFS